MHADLVDRLCCPSCGGSLRLKVELIKHVTGEIDAGRLDCASCGASYPISRGIPRFVRTESYASSFGRQWTRYAVERREEDEETFLTKTGVRPDQLAGLNVLDAGCGGGRYSLVAARHGARLVAVDMSAAVGRAACLCADFPNVDFVQADLMRLPVMRQSIDLAFSIGVLHHARDPAAAFHQVAAAVRPGGRLAVWLYRRNTLVQECVNEVLRGITRRMKTAPLETIAALGAALGSIPLVNRTLNKVINFSNHPAWENRRCDTFDWYSPRYQSHHTLAELEAWFRGAGFDQLRELPPAKSGRLYRWAYERNLLIGSGVNMVGIRRRNQ